MYPVYNGLFLELVYFLTSIRMSMSLEWTLGSDQVGDGSNRVRSHSSTFGFSCTSLSRGNCDSKSEILRIWQYTTKQFKTAVKEPVFDLPGG